MVIFVLFITFLTYSELDVSLKDLGYIANYIKPFYSDDIQPELFEQFSKPNNDIASINVSALGGVNAEVRRVIDGDTIDVFLNDEVQRIRYIGVNTPERNEPCYTEATEANKDLVSGRTVVLVKDTSETDQFDRLLRYVYVGNIFVNAELVLQGYAEAVLYRPDDDHYEIFREAEQVATKAGIGCHVSGVFDDNTFTR